jgi:hypothetical protein
VILKIGNNTYRCHPTPEQRPLLLEAVQRANASRWPFQTLESDPVVKNVKKEKLL